MKYKCFFFLIVLLCSAHLCTAKDMHIDSIRIISTHYYTTTAVPVYCEDMFRELEIIESRLIVDTPTINRFVVNLKRAKEYKADFKGIDTRAVVYIYYKNQTVRKLCLSTTKVFSDNGKIKIFKNWEVHNFIFPVRLQKIQ